MGPSEQDDEDSSTPPTTVPGPGLVSSSSLQPVSFGTAVVLVAPRVVSATGAIALALPIALEVPSLLRSVGAAALVAVQTGQWMPVWISAGVAASAVLLVLAVANKRGIQQLTGLVTAIRDLRAGK